MAGIKKNRKIIFIILAILTVVVVAGLIFWDSVKYPLIRKEATDQVFEKSKGLYRMQYDKLDLDEVSGFLRVTNLRITPDTAMFSQQISEEKNLPLLIDIKIPELIVRGVKTPEAMINKSIEGRRLEIKNPQVHCYYHKPEKDSAVSGTNKEIYEQLLGNLNLISADSIDISDATLTISDFIDKRELLKLDSINVQLLDVLIDSTHQSDSSRFYFSKSAHASIASVSFGTKNKTYDFKMDSVDFDTDKKVLFLHTFRVIPLMSEKAFAKFSKVQKDRLNIAARNITVSEIDIPALSRGDLIAEEMKLGSIMLHLSKDLSYPHDGKNRVGTYPQQALMKVPFPVYIKTLIAGPADIEVKQKNPKSDESGTLEFKESSIQATNVTNMESRINKDNHLKIAAHTKFMGLTNVKADFDLILNNKDGRFSLKGTASGFNATELNKVLIPLGLAKVESAQVNQLRFDLKLSDYQGTGTVVLLYKDLKMTLLKKDSIEQKLEKKKLASFISNVILKDANPDKKDTRIAHPVFERDKVRSFWHLIWFTIFTGVKETVGMNKGKS